MPISRRSFLSGSLTMAAGGTLVAACSPGEQSPPTGTGTTGGGGAEPEALAGSIRFSTWVGEKDTPMWEAVIAAFQEKNPEVEIDFEPLSSADYWTKRATEFASGTAPDVLGMGGRIATLAPAGQILPLDSYVSASELATLVPTLLEGGQASVDGAFQQYALPWRFVGMPLHGNLTALERAGVSVPDASWTRDDFVDMLKELTRPDQWGIAPLAESRMSSIASTFGAWPTDETGAIPTLDTPEMAACLEFCRDLIYVHKVAPQIGVLSDQANPFATESIALYFDGSWAWPTFREVEFDWDVLPLPLDPSGTHQPLMHAGADGLSVYAKSEKIDIAVAFLKFAVLDPVAAELIASVGDPAVTERLFEPSRVAEIAAQLPANYEQYLGEAVELGKNWSSSIDQTAGVSSPIFTDATISVYASADSDIEKILRDAQARAEAAVAELGL